MSSRPTGDGGSDHGTMNLEWARRWVDALIGGGVTEVQLCPGSRSTPLVLACHERAELRIRVHIDERSAAFFALGFGRRAGRPSVVLTTSGTAVANLLPAAVEAAASDVPLILMTADRPPWLRGTDANQTVLQPGIFSGHARAVFDVPLPSEEGLSAGVPGSLAENVLLAVAGPPPGPVHVNLPFDKPLHPRTVDAVRRPSSSPEAGSRLHASSDQGGPSAGNRPAAPPTAGRRDAPTVGADPSGDARQISHLLGRAKRPLVIAGPSADPDQDGPAVQDLARRLGIPLLADPLSGARFGEGSDEVAVSTYAAICGHPESVDFLAPDLIVRTGRTFTSSSLERALMRWSDRASIREAGPKGPGPVSPAEGVPRHVVVDAGSVRKDHLGLADWYVERAPADLFAEVEAPEVPNRHAWLADWKGRDRAARQALNDSLTIPGNEAAFVAAAVRAAPNGATIFMSNSMPVRDLDLVGDPAWGSRRVLGNRGASGIDGIVSTALGVAAASEEPVVAVVGDLALLHDTNGLLRARDEDLDAVLVVIDNDGGGIFHMLPIESFEPAFTPYFATPHGLDLAKSAALYDVPFLDAATPEDLGVEVRRALQAGGVRMIRCRTDRRRNQQAHARTRELVAARLGSLVERVP